MDFSITSRLNQQDYIKVMFIGLYKKPVFIIGAVMGVCLLTTVILNYFNLIDFYQDTPWFEGIGGLLLLSFPLLIVIMSVNQIKSNPNLLNDMTYTFTDTGMAVTGLTFKSEFSWEHIIKRKELGQYLILYHTKRFGNFIEKSKLTPEQLFFIKNRVPAK